ncbi:hypothetical protein GSI_13310 [Ganoderma sinense ZZ0214-1]|uniref:HAT C-terminal dimerisation domain-containing protein n=1 Tax=Ganoderma sinense ZZ0214-1 TaxID=1077348 RepID=A0A2G8RV80_9APHY|nr:hypothetical protein GSI_13310 [Ganoderma sinense ZZ0214-1]
MPISSTLATSDSATHETRSKRRRETSSQGLLGDQNPATHPAAPGNGDSISAAAPRKSSQGDGVVKKRHKADSAAPKRPSPSQGTAGKKVPSRDPITLSDDELSVVGSDGDEGASAIKASARTAAQLAGVQGSNGRRARFAQRFAGLTAEQTLAELSKSWRSSVYKHFSDPIIVKGPNGSTVHRFTCKRHPSKHVDRMEYQESTGNLSRHVKACDPEETPETEMITAYASGAQYSPARLRFLVAMWCARRHRAFQIVEDAEFREVLHMLYAKARLPSRVTVSRDVQAIHAMAKANVIEMFNGLPSKIHVAVDGWTSPNVTSFLGVTAHWHDEAEINHVILDFIKLTSAHTADNLAEKLLECFREFGIENKVLGITSDNAKTNDAMMRHLKMLHPESRGPDGRVRCFAHILSLVVKAVMSQFGRRKGKALPHEIQALRDPNDQDDGDGIRPGDMDASREAADDEVIENMEEDHPELRIDDQDVKLVQVALEKIARLSQRVWYSPQIRAELARLAGDAGINSEVLVRMVKTRWNTVATVLARALELRPVLDDLCDMHHFNGEKSARLRRYILTNEEWTVLEQLHGLLDPFLFATNEISSSTRGLVHEVIPYIDILTAHLDDFQDNLALTTGIRSAAKRGRLMLILHPAFKLVYFRKAEWPEDWIDEARALATEEWTSHYKPAAPANGKAGPANGQGAASRSRPRPFRMSTGGKMPARATRDLFASIGARAAGPEHDALEAYLEAPPLTTVKDPLAYWNAALKSGSEDPALARMALDFLSVPATSVDVERAFSRGRLMVNRLRTALSDRSVCAGTVLGSWARVDGLVVESDAVKLLAGKKGAHASTPARADAIKEADLDGSSGAELSELEDDDEVATASFGVEDATYSDDDMYA